MEECRQDTRRSSGEESADVSGVYHHPGPWWFDVIECGLVRRYQWLTGGLAGAFEPGPVIALSLPLTVHT